MSGRWWQRLLWLACPNSGGSCLAEQPPSTPTSGRLPEAFLPSSWMPEPSPQGPPPHASLPHSCHPPTSLIFPFQLEERKTSSREAASHQPGQPASLGLAPAACRDTPPPPNAWGLSRAEKFPFWGSPASGGWASPPPSANRPSSPISSDRVYSPSGPRSRVPTPVGLPPLCPVSSLPSCKGRPLDSRQQAGGTRGRCQS